MPISIQNFVFFVCFLFIFFGFAMWISVRSLAILGQSGHFFKAAVARDGGRPVLLAVFCFQERGEVFLPPRPLLLLFLSLGEMSVQFVALRLQFDAEDVNS